MALLPNRAIVAKQGINVSTPLSLLGGEAYRLTLCPELGNNSRSVLIVQMTVQFQFSDSNQKWTSGGKANFAAGFVSAVKSAWDDKFRITTSSTVPAEPYRNVGVLFDLKTYIDGIHIDEDFELSVTKIPSGSFSSSCVMYTMGNANLDSEDLVPISKGAGTQRGAVHEFGHMLGLNDEYPAAKGNMNWTADTESIMHSGEKVRPRHYVPFATWLTSKFAVASRLLHKPTVYKVDGTWDSSNSLL